MKRDLLVALIAIVVVVALCFGLSSMRVPVPATKSRPFTAKLSNEPGTPGNVILRVNGEPVTESEFAAVFETVPEQIQQQFRSEQGKQAFAEQIIRLKIVEQEGRKLGLERDPKVAGQISADRTNVLAQATMPKLAPPPSDADVQKFYNEHKAQFSTVDLSHILVAYQGGAIPPRGGRALTQEQAAAKAVELYQQIQGGADFAQVARQSSDDVQSAANGGKLGPYSPGRLPQEIDAQVQRLRPGQVSGPILSQFGIHLFKVGSATPVPLAQIKPQLIAQLQRENAFKRVEELRKAAKVDFDPKFFPEGDRLDTSGAATPGAAGPAVGPRGAAPLGTRPAAKPPQSRP